MSETRDAGVSIVPIGGLGEFGLNMMVYQYGDDIIVVDAGLMFPEADMPGVDLVFRTSHICARIEIKLRVSLSPMPMRTMSGDLHSSSAKLTCPSMALN